MLIELAIVFLLLILNACFALSEMAIVSASKPLLRQQEKAGSKSARVALQLAENPGRFLSTVQVGITLVGIIAGAYGGATIAEDIAPYLNRLPFISPSGETMAVVVVVTLLTYFSVVMGELIPKQVALNNPEKFALIVALPMYALSRMCGPIVGLLEHSARGMLAVLGVKKTDETVTENEIKAVIAEGAASGAIEQDEHDIIKRVIRLGDRDVTSIMTHRADVVFIDIDDTLETVRAKIGGAEHSRYPVSEGDTSKVIGMIKAKELFAADLSADRFRVIDFMKEVTFIPEGTDCLKALETFKQKRINMAVVVDEYGSIQGIFTPADILEAMVGVMASNYAETDDPMIFQRQDGSWLVDGLTPVDEVNIALGAEVIPVDDDYQTLAGFLLHCLAKLPEIGEIVEYGGYSLEIVDMDGRRIDKILLKPPVKK